MFDTPQRHLMPPLMPAAHYQAIPSYRLRNVREWHLHRIMILQSWGKPYSTGVYLDRHVVAVREMDAVLRQRDD